MLHIAAISGLTVLWITGAILLVLAIGLIFKMIREDPGDPEATINRIRARWYKGEIEDETYDERLHHQI